VARDEGREDRLDAGGGCDGGAFAGVVVGCVGATFAAVICADVGAPEACDNDALAG
jgi:uncharacterized membrane protein YeaQ/YmgE (transglycosylase-associated protein family)